MDDLGEAVLAVTVDAALLQHIPDAWRQYVVLMRGGMETNKARLCTLRRV